MNNHRSNYETKYKLKLFIGSQPVPLDPFPTFLETLLNCPRSYSKALFVPSSTTFLIGFHAPIKTRITKIHQHLKLDMLR
ncbi:hypothetical protein BpHYR1_023124 [Brachionus plicatilis]|uniref:Uncharacterized protein n=1 Tax=Brachionus plicatilis TaxID=10195 RepID=A0A3M7QND3_BRAPC|nr:hypothetical protein BpHYR1_023124 [Brachionus plicatilis]